MAVIKIKTPTVSTNIRTSLSQEYSSGSTIYVESPTGFTQANYIVVGEPGLEKTEVTSITGAPGTDNLTIGALNFSHPKGTPVYYTRWNQYDLYYQTTTAGSWIQYGSMPTNLRWDALFAEYQDTSATSAYQWKYRYYSTEATAYSDYSDVISTTGWADNAVGYMVRNVRKIINDPESKTITDTEVIRFFNAAQDKINALYDRWWFLLKEGTAITTVTSTNKYALPTDFGRMHSLIFNYVNGASNVNYQLKYVSLAEMDYQSRDNNSAVNDSARHYTILPGDSTSPAGYLKIWPIPETAGLNIYPRYYKTPADLDSYGDTTDITIPAMLEDYALSQIYKIRKEEDKAVYYDKLFREQVDLLKLLQRKQAGPPRYLWQYKGRKAMERLYGNTGRGSDWDVENNF